MDTLHDTGPLEEGEGIAKVNYRQWCDGSEPDVMLDIGEGDQLLECCVLESQFRQDWQCSDGNTTCFVRIDVDAE